MRLQDYQRNQLIKTLTSMSWLLVNTEHLVDRSQDCLPVKQAMKQTLSRIRGELQASKNLLDKVQHD